MFFVEPLRNWHRYRDTVETIKELSTYKDVRGLCIVETAYSGPLTKELVQTITSKGAGEDKEFISFVAEEGDYLIVRRAQWKDDSSLLLLECFSPKYDFKRAYFKEDGFDLPLGSFESRLSYQDGKIFVYDRKGHLSHTKEFALNFIKPKSYYKLDLPNRIRLENSIRTGIVVIAILILIFGMLRYYLG